MEPGALSHLRVGDLTDERGIYGAKLLADLGAHVIRPEPPDGDTLRQRGPHHCECNSDGESGYGDSSLYYAFFASNRKSFVVDAAKPESVEQFRRLLELADVVLYCDKYWTSELVPLSELFNEDEAGKQGNDRIVVNVSSFGTAGPWRDFQAPDLVAGALAGAVATTGDVDTPPLKGFGELNFMVSGVYAAIAALSALRARTEFGVAQQVDVSVHESIASCLEHVFMFYWYAQNALGRPEETVLPRRGATHWSNLYTVMNG